MISDSVKIARMEAQTKQLEAVKSMLTNPVVMSIAGFILIEYLQSSVVEDKVIWSDGSVTYKQRRVPGGGWLGSVAGSVIEGGLAGHLIASGLPPGTPELISTVGTKLLSKV